MNQCNNCKKNLADDLVKCPECGSEEFTAIIESKSELTETIKSIPSQPRKEKKGVFHYIGITVVAIVIIFIGLVIIGLLLPKDSNKPTDQGSQASVQPQDDQLKEVELTVDLNELVEVYDTNEIKADDLYKGKIVQVSGVVSSINKDFDDQPYIVLGTGELFELQGIRCSITDKAELDKAAELVKGDLVAVIGTCDGLGFMDVVLNDCTINKTSAENSGATVDSASQIMPVAGVEDSLKKDLEKYLDDSYGLTDLRNAALNEFFNIQYNEYLKEHGVDDEASMISTDYKIINDYVAAYAAIESNVDVINELNSKNGGTDGGEDNYKEYMNLRKQVRALFRENDLSYPYESGEVIEENGLNVHFSDYKFSGLYTSSNGNLGTISVTVAVTNNTKETRQFSFYGIDLSDIQNYDCEMYDMLGKGVYNLSPGQTAQSTMVFICRYAPSVFYVQIGDETYQWRLLP